MENAGPIDFLCNRVRTRTPGRPSTGRGFRVKGKFHRMAYEADAEKRPACLFCKHRHVGRTVCAYSTGRSDVCVCRHST